MLLTNHIDVIIKLRALKLVNTTLYTLHDHWKNKLKNWGLKVHFGGVSKNNWSLEENVEN